MAGNINDDKLLNPEGIKSNLVRASLYLFSYELLRTAIVDKLKDFFLTGFDENGYTYSDDYKTRIVNRKIDGKQNIFLSSLYWLEEHNAITKDEIAEIIAIREHRNDVAHRIDKILCENDYNIDGSKEKRIFELIKKIELWWIVEVEIPTNPENKGREIIEEGIVSGTEILYTYIKTISDDLLKK